jgi:GntR family transcriptional regulator/MocR family aminotransferase
MKTTKYQTLYEELKTMMLEGKFKPHEKLPSKRKLAYAAFVSVFTVQNAYDQLLMEGYIYTKEKIGYFVSEGVERTVKTTTPFETITQQSVSIPYHLSFKTNVVDNTLFPLSVWHKLSREVLSSSLFSLMNVTPAKGVLELRVEIAKYLEIYRGMRVSPDQIVVGSGTQPLLNLLVELLGRQHTYAIENPGYGRIHQTLTGLGVKTTAIEVDAYGLSLQALLKSEAEIVHITPAHQFPTGIIMPIQRRLALLKWANEQKTRYIIEDDYDSEFRYTGAPVSSLFGLEINDQVIYMNSLSKSLGPAFKIGYVVLPKALLPLYEKIKNHHSCTVPNFEQYILYKFMHEGYFDRHLNKTRQIYKKKLEIIKSKIQTKPYLEMMGDEAGLHFMLRIHTQVPEYALVEKLQSRGIEVRGLLDYYIHHIDLKPHVPTLVLGYSGIPLTEIESHISTLIDTIEALI